MGFVCTMTTSAGSCGNRSAAERRLRQMKEMGVNAIRITHNPASSILLDVAAKMGLLIQEEAFDTWYGGKKEYDYGRFFLRKKRLIQKRKQAISGQITICEL